MNNRPGGQQAAPTVAESRSFLFVPGNRPERFAKAVTSGADQVIIDLEDAVAPEDKVAARESVVHALADTQALVRINSVETQWYEADLAALSGAAGLLGVVLPKAEFAGGVAQVVGTVSPGTAVLPLIETARGIRDAAVIAQVPGISRLLFGNLDFALDCGIHVQSPREEELSYARSALVIASRAAGLPGPVDGICTNIDDMEQCHADTVRALNHGFTAKLCIHPKQVAAVHAAFAPSAAELNWALRILEAAASAGGAAVRVDGQMVDRPVLQRAQAIVAVGGDGVATAIAQE